MCNRTTRSVLSVLLVLCLLLGMGGNAIALTAKAAESTETFNYVSLGASQTNGYGLQGYLPITVNDGEVTDPEQLQLLQGLLSGQISKNDINVYGYQRVPEGSYPDLIRDALEAEGYQVNVDQMAISSMRVEELRVLLEDDYYGDGYTRWRFYDENGNGWFSSAAKKEGMTNAEALAALRGEYRGAIADADLITFDLGVNNFGVYLINQIDAGLNGKIKYETDITDVLQGKDLERYYTVRAEINELFENTLGDIEEKSQMTIDFMVDTFAYAMVGFCVNFDKSMEYIYAMNPDVDVVVVSIQNLMKGMNARIPGVEEEIPLGKIYGAVVDMANLYTAVDSPYADRYYYADAGDVTLFLNDILAYDGNYESLDQDMKDCFGLYDNDLFGWELYLMFSPDYSQVPAELKKAAAKEVYEALADIAKICAQKNVMDFGALDNDDAEDALGDFIETSMQEAIVAGMSGQDYELDASVLENPDYASAMAIAIRFNIGNSFFAHPNRQGHQERAEAVLAAIKDKISGRDVVEEEILNILKDIYEMAVESGKIEEELQALYEVIEELKAQIENTVGEQKQKLEALYQKVLELKAAVENVITDGVTALETALRAINAVIDAAEKAAELVSELPGKVMEVATDLKSALVALYEGAVHDTYVVDQDSYYVAIGDGTAVSESYVDLLAEELGVDYKNLAVNGMLVNGAYDILAQNKADIEKADLITLGFGSNTFMNYTVDRVVTDTINGIMDADAVKTELDWTPYVGEEGAVKVEAALVELYNYFVEQGLGEQEIEYEVQMGAITAVVTATIDTAEIMTSVVESYVYAAASYACDLPKVIDEIHEINPEAVVVIVGTYNPLEDVVVTLGENALAIGEYVDYLVTAANVHNFAYALLNENTIFVEAADVETVNEAADAATTVSAMELLELYVDLEGITSGNATVPAGEETNPSEAGHAYIKDQILDSLSVHSIVDTGRTLSLEGVIYVNQYVKLEGFEGVDVEKNGGLLVWDHAVTEETAVYGTETTLKEGLIKAGKEYMQQTDGIAAKEYADTMWLRIYVQLPDGTYVYGPLKEYSVRYYCETVIGRNDTTKLADTCIAMLHYGAAAQTYFNYNTTDLANKNIAEKYPADAWNADLLTKLDAVDTDIAASTLVKDNGRTLSLNGAIQINTYYGFSGNAETAELLVWTDAEGKLTAENVTYTVAMELVKEEWVGHTAGIAAKEYGKTIYVCAHFVDAEGNDHYSEVVAFSPEEYARKVIGKDGANPKLVDLVQKMVVYGEYARINFSK